VLACLWPVKFVPGLLCDVLLAALFRKNNGFSLGVIESLNCGPVVCMDWLAA